MKKAIIVTENCYPEGDAGAIRQHSFAKMLTDIGYDVLVIGYGMLTDGRKSIYDGIEYISFRCENKEKIFRICNRIMFGNKMFDYISNNYLELDLLFVVDLMPNAFKKVLQLKEKYNCVIVHDSVEWYSKEEFRYGKFNLAYLRKEYTNTKAIDTKWNFVAISRYLENHFCSRVNKVICIPVIMDIENINYRINVKQSEKIIFSYAGGPGKKDYLKEIINGFALLEPNELKKIELNIIGVNKEQLIDICKVNKSAFTILGPALKIHGRVKRDVAMKFINESDYSLLIRDENLRYSKAGFPTKIVESLACGTPPLCNYSSDLDLYLNDKKNSIIANGHSPEDVCDAIRKALAITGEKERESMRKSARETALTYFDYSAYEDLLMTICKN